MSREAGLHHTQCLPKKKTNVVNLNISPFSPLLLLNIMLQGTGHPSGHLGLAVSFSRLLPTPNLLSGRAV